MGDRELALKGFRRERGLLWPDFDRRCAEVTFSETESALPKVLGYVADRRVVVQAGGNCGQLVIPLAAEFGAVYSFEPDPMNFVALAVNTASLSHVFRFQAALGSQADRGRLRGLQNGDTKHPDNCGAWYMSGEGRIPTLAIDDLALPICDLLMLDIEGGELQALHGAGKTIARCRPVIVIEDKGLGAQFFGQESGAAERHLIEAHDYWRTARIKNDTVMVPA